MTFLFCLSSLTSGPDVAFALLLLPSLLIVSLSLVGSTSKTTSRDVKTEDVYDKGSQSIENVSAQLGEIRVTKILVHPIKSCRGTSVMESEYNPEGLEHDRKWCIMDANKHVVLTARELPKMVLVHPRLIPDHSSPYGGVLQVTVPMDDGPVMFSVPISPPPEVLSTWEIIPDCTMHVEFVMDGYVCQGLSRSEPSPHDILTQFFGRQVLLMMKGPTTREVPSTLEVPDLKASSVFQDVFPLLVTSEESLVDVARAIKDAAQKKDDEEGRIGGLDKERWSNDEVEMERFRPNIVIKGAGIPWAEDMWRTITIQHDDDSTKPATNILLVSKCARCLLPNVDIRTGVRDAAVPYKVLMKFRTGKDPARMSKPCFGCNGVPEGHGTVRVGDKVVVKEWGILV